MTQVRAINETHRNTETAAGRLECLFDVEHRTALAMLTIAAELGEYQLNGIQVTGDDDDQSFTIRSL